MLELHQKGHRVYQFHRDLDLTKIAAKKAEYLAKKGYKNSSTKRVLYELVAGLNELCEIDSEASDSVKTFFGDLIDDGDYFSSSESAADQSFSKESMFFTAIGAVDNFNTQSDSDF